MPECRSYFFRVICLSVHGAVGVCCSRLSRSYFDTYYIVLAFLWQMRMQTPRDNSDNPIQIIDYAAAVAVPWSPLPFRASVLVWYYLLIRNMLNSPVYCMSYLSQLLQTIVICFTRCRLIMMKRILHTSQRRKYKPKWDICQLRMTDTSPAEDKPLHYIPYPGNSLAIPRHHCANYHAPMRGRGLISYHESQSVVSQRSVSSQ